MHPIDLLVNEQFSTFRAIVTRALDNIKERRLVSLKRAMGAQLALESKEAQELEEANVVRQGRIKLIRRRIRKGKVQRNIRKSAVKGYTLRKGKLTRIPAARKIRMKIVQRRAARKRKAHLQQSLRRRRISLRKRKALGIKE